MERLARLEQLAENAVISVEHYGVAAITGEQRDDYLHGQLTINTKEFAHNSVRHAAHCDFKGKAWALMYALRHQETQLLTMHRDALSQSLAQLQKYGVFSKVDISDASQDYGQWLLHGPQAEAALQSHFGSLPEAELTTLQTDDSVVFALPGASPMYWLLSRSADKVLAPLRDQDAVVWYGSEVFEAVQIANGIPAVSGNSVNAFVPQMMNVQALKGIDFDKGCYMGQEVVARTHFLGKNKRAAFSFRLPVATKAAVDDTLEKQVGDNWRRGGTVIRAAQLGEETWLMAVLSNDTQPQDNHRLAEAPEHVVTAEPLPYSIVEDKGSTIRGRK
ncbi:glycine cleavage system protein T [Alteromonas sp. ASW11-19]|uniref:Glycine cleavage system protein T n=1 Tax=Alteromonas salexigens TaxID=2982530 RepID=A0ABT2VRI2_9ALTE|nr:glycine cleavage system protein T [Alteromonas salexigens]MCU7555735.1 glycine cleavage system protein T [Alteromonas salexigens]